MRTQDVVEHNRKLQRYQTGRPDVPYPRGSMRADVRSADPLYKQQGMRKHGKPNVTDLDKRKQYYEQREKTGVRGGYGKKANLPPDNPLEDQITREQLVRGRVGQHIQASRRVSENTPRLPKDRPPGPPKPPGPPPYRPPAGGGRSPPKPPVPKGPYHGPGPGPTIKGEALDDILALAEKSNAKGIKGESVKRLRQIIENAADRAGGEGTAKRLAAARAKALHGEKPKPKGEGYWSWGGSLTRALVDEFRGRRMSDEELEKRRKERRAK